MLDISKVDKYQDVYLNGNKKHAAETGRKNKFMAVALFQRKPKLLTYTLHSLHLQLSGFHFLTLQVNSCKDSDFLILLGNISHVFGPLNDKSLGTIVNRFNRSYFPELFIS